MSFEDAPFIGPFGRVVRLLKWPQKPEHEDRLHQALGYRTSDKVYREGWKGLSRAGLME